MLVPAMYFSNCHRIVLTISALQPLPRNLTLLVWYSYNASTAGSTHCSGLLIYNKMRWTSCSLSGPQSLILCVIPWFIGIIIVKSRNSRKGVGSPLDISPIDISRISPEFYSLVSDSARQLASKDNQSEHSTNDSNSCHSSSSKELTLGYSKIGSGNITSLSARRGDDAKKDEDWLPDWYTSNDDIGTMLRKRREKILHR